MQSRPNDLISLGAVDLYWIPLGAGGHVVRLNGKVYEVIKALVERRPRYDLHHTALDISVPDGRFVIESAPIRDDRGRERGVVGEGPVGTRWAWSFRLFRYEIRRWREGLIPDATEAVSSPVRVANDITRATGILELVPSVPMLVWGRDELRTGDNVELQLADLMVASSRGRGNVDAATACGWARPRLARGSGASAPSDRDAHSLRLNGESDP